MSARPQRAVQARYFDSNGVVLVRDGDCMTITLRVRSRLSPGNVARELNNAFVKLSRIGYRFVSKPRWERIPGGAVATLNRPLSWTVSALRTETRRAA